MGWETASRFRGVRVCVMPPPSLWSGNLRLSLVLIPVRLVPAVSTEEAISFRQIHEPSGTPIRYLKGVHDGDTFTEVPEEEIVKGYEHPKDITQMLNLLRDATPLPPIQTKNEQLLAVS
jgi:non-homologous end joining protein Ku